ncbi:protein lin-54 homolog isoform X2 [Danaus plexippus]|uniref:protein lin-54 homolog isoform X2 n=1 Tax=Danaus plexippus TaxID=13037 RepID=UPI002AAFC421|nr:protein lin-54 homolog isoform X2 [Danaus plexippus]
MDHNLDDSLNLENAMGVDFGHTDDVEVSQASITLIQSGHDESIPMEFEHSEEQPMLMDTGNEEIIVSDFMSDQFTLQEYSVQSDQTTELTTTVESNQQHMLTSQTDTLVDIQFTPQIVSNSTITQDNGEPKMVAVKSLLPKTTKKSDSMATLATMPRQVAIAPKPPKLVSKTFAPKQLAIAPKPVTMISNRGQSLVKKVSLANVIQGTTKGKTVLAQIGKQLIMVPSGSQKIKLVTAAPGTNTVQYVRADGEQAQLIVNKNTGATQNKPLLTKLITVPGATSDSNAPAVITKIEPSRFVVQQKTIPLTVGNKVLMATPSKQPVRLSKKQEIITIKSPTPKLMPATAINTATKQKVIINPSVNAMLKAAAAQKKIQNPEDGATVAEGGKSQLHQINVPGKGIQYIRLVTNSSSETPKPVPKQLMALPSKTFVLTDNKGNLIQMTAEKMSAGQPPSLVVTGKGTAVNKLNASKPPQKLVRIAPIVKTSQTVTSPASLLAPLSPGSPERDPSPAQESKVTLRALVEQANDDCSLAEVEVDFKKDGSPTPEDSMDSIDQYNHTNKSEDHPLIVIPSAYDQMIVPDDSERMDESQDANNTLNVDMDMTNYQSPTTPALSETDQVTTELGGLRPRKACNCTKSQCLKLYCDCFANGEFCNRCNCNNCHNNLENEELRQKAIRGCLDRNPNAFRPKIGKSKAGGPEIIRRHNKGCNCKRSGCLKNYCECYEAKIACSSICKCVGCRNVEETLERGRRRDAPRALQPLAGPPTYRPHVALAHAKQPCSFMTSEVIEAVCQCLIAAAVDNKEEAERRDADPMRDVIEEFARCLQDIISAAHQSAPLALLDEGPA